MIYTVTLNPSLDYVVRLSKLNLGDINRTNESFMFPGGKGINVSRILKRLDADTTAWGFLGGEIGEFIETRLKSENILTDFTPVAGQTRINVKVRATEETEINGAGPKITDSEVQNFFNKLANLTDKDIVVISGSTPASLDQNFYREIIKIIKEKGANFIVDTSDKSLLEILPNHPLLVKPNGEELGALFDTKINDLKDVETYGRKLLDKGAQNVIISLAGDGACLITKDISYFAEPIKIQVQNSVGAGDSMVAGFVGTYHNTKDIIESFKVSVACGTATAASEDLATKDVINEMLQKVALKKL